MNTGTEIIDINEMLGWLATGFVFVVIIGTLTWFLCTEYVTKRRK